MICLPILSHAFDISNSASKNICNSGCNLSIVETIPANLFYLNSSMQNPSTSKTWLQLIDSAKRSIEIVTKNWNLENNDNSTDFGIEEGEAVLSALFQVSKYRDIKIKIAQSSPTDWYPNNNVEVNMKKLNIYYSKIVEISYYLEKK